MFWEAETGPRVIFGGPKARILRILRSDPRLPRRITKTIVFYAEKEDLCKSKNNVLPLFRFEKTTNVSAKIVPLASSRHLRKPRRALKGS